MSQPPKAEDILRALIMKHGSSPLMPQDPLGAAQWFMALQKPPDEWLDKPEQIGCIGGGTRWETPYISRLGLNLLKFLKLQPQDQEYIIGAAGDKVFWEGDEMPFFYLVYDQTMLMRDIGIEKYRSRASQMARALVKSHGG